MAQKKNLERAATTVNQPVDRFQSAAGEKIETFGRKFEGKGKPILYGLLALLGLVIAGGIIYNYSQRTAAAAQTALGKAIDIHTAQVTPSPDPKNTETTFPTDKERAEKAITAFEEVASKYGSPHKEKAQYFIAVNRLKLDRAAGLQELENLAKSGGGEVATLAKFALAQAKFADGKYDEAAALYTELRDAKTGIVADETLNYSLAQTYEKQGKTQDAVSIYFDLVSQARQAKTPDGDPIEQSQTAREAATKLEKLAPNRYADLPAEQNNVKTYTF